MSGYATATLKVVFAVPVGSRQPCSQSCIVRAKTPRSEKKSCCDRRPTRAGASAAGLSTTTVTRRICLIEARRSFRNRTRSEGIFNSFLEFNQELGQQVVELGLGVGDEKPHLVPLPQAVNVPRAAPLVSGACSPALSYNQVANFLVCCDTADEFASLLGGPDFRCILDEDR